MNLYAILRRNGWRSPEQLQTAAVRSIEEGGRRDDRLRWIKSYVLDEAGGGVGMMCFYEAVSAEALREHAEAAGLPCDEVVEVTAALVGREDPVRTASVPT